MMIVAWLRDVPDLDASPSRLVREALRAELQDSDRAPFGIVILHGHNPQSVQRIREWAGNARVVVVLAPGLRLPAEVKWALLAAGTADVLDWPGEERLAEIILPRIARWTEIEALMTGDRAVRSAVGESAAWRGLLRHVVEIAAFSQAGLLLTGETGTGKEQIARLVHALDRRQRKAELVTVDCTTLSRDLMASELFGHERGAFTGALAAHDGAIALAHRGTLFLDEIGELDLPLQAQLLRVIQERSFKRVGSNVWQPADFRLICATNRDLEQEVREGRFRADLYYRIADRTLSLPPLRDRREDILPLAEHFWGSVTGSKQTPEFDPALRQYLTTRDYPGNVRDLRRIIMALHGRHVGGATVSLGALPERERPMPPPSVVEEQDVVPVLSDPWENLGFIGAIETAIARGIGLREIGRAASSAAMRIALAQEGGNLQRAARRLGVTDRALQMRRASGGPMMD
jgi:transcriptional regulator with GAF, ATPase, and Fis domain